MKTLKINKKIAAIGLALMLLFGTGVAGSMLGIDTVTATYACGHGNGGGC